MAENSTYEGEPATGYSPVCWSKSADRIGRLWRHLASSKCSSVAVVGVPGRSAACAKPSRAHMECDDENRDCPTSKRTEPTHEIEKMLIDRRSQIRVDSHHPIRLD
jgi:hypothetical protein